MINKHIFTFLLAGSLSLGLAQDGYGAGYPDKCIKQGPYFSKRIPSKCTASMRSIVTASGNLLLGAIGNRSTGKGWIQASVHPKTFNPKPGSRMVEWALIDYGGNQCNSTRQNRPNIQVQAEYTIQTHFEGPGWNEAYLLCANKAGAVKIFKKGKVPGSFSCTWQITDRNLGEFPHLMMKKGVLQADPHPLWNGEGFGIYSPKAGKYLTAVKGGGDKVILKGNTMGINQTFWLSDFYVTGAENGRVRHKCSKTKRKPSPVVKAKRKGFSEKRLKNKYSGLCLTGPLIKGGPRPLQQHPCTTNKYSKWTIRGNHGILYNQHYSSVNKASSGLIKLTKNDVKPGHHKAGRPKSNKKEKHGVFLNSKGQIQEWSSGKCLDLKRKSKLWGINFVWRKCNDSKTQKFDVF